MAASSLHHNKSYLGDKYRRLRARLSPPKAITAMAHQLARIIWTLITRQVPFDLSLFAEQEKSSASTDGGDAIPPGPYRGSSPEPPSGLCSSGGSTGVNSGFGVADGGSLGPDSGL